MHRGIFITFEGTEGAGKSTLIQNLIRRFTSKGLESIATREPGGTELAEKIRALILNNDMQPLTELFLYEAARVEHLAHSIIPALQAKKIVLCDRFVDSTLAYQSSARGLPWETVHLANQIAIEKNIPHLKVLLDIDPAQGLSRATDPNRFEKAGVEFQKKVRRGYLRAIRSEPKKWLHILVRQQTPSELADLVFEEICKRLKIRGRKK